MWRVGGTVGVQPGQLTIALDDFRVRIEDFSKLAMKTDADIGGKFRMLRHQTLCGAHDEFEMSDVITVLGADHQKFILIGRPSMQTVSSIKHEYLERGDAVIAGEMFHFLDVPCLNRCDVISVIDPESSLGLFQYFGHEVAVRAAAV